MRRATLAIRLLCLALPVLADAGAVLADGVIITPDFAAALYGRISVLRESDGCRLARFDTERSRIVVGLEAPPGTSGSLEIDAMAAAAGGRRAGDWTLDASRVVQRDCAATLVAIESVLAETAAPRTPVTERTDRRSYGYANRLLLAATFVLLVAWTAWVLLREARARRPSSGALLALAAVWAASLALRLLLSPHTFLHEYYHVAETLSGYLGGDSGPLYGDTGPALFQLVAAVLGRPDDAQVIFTTNAVLASLAIPAVALLDLRLSGSWPRALCAAVLLGVLPQHLRFSASEVLFVQAVTFGAWALALSALYFRTRRLGDSLCAVLALSLAMQTRPEMLFWPAAVVTLVLLAEPRSWRVLFERRTLAAFAVLAILLIPRVLELRGVVGGETAPPPALPPLETYLRSLVLFDGRVTPWVYWPLLLVGLLWGLRFNTGLVAWVVVVFVGLTSFSLSLYNNGPYNVRSQLLPTSFVVLIAAGAAPAWMALWGSRRGVLALGALLVGVAGAVVIQSRGFVTELRDQQLEWAFLERSVPTLPRAGRLLAAVEIGGRNLAAFPQFLLRREGKTYRLVDVRRAAGGEVPWPEPGDDLFFYQGMYCYFASPNEEPPERMTAVCRAVHERYLAEAVVADELDTAGYSALSYAPGPFRIGFFRLRERR